MAEADHTEQRNAGQRKGRHRVIEACLPCHRQKRRCDRKRPCSHCLKRCIAGQCVYEAANALEQCEFSSDTATVETENEALRLRVVELEAALENYKAQERTRSRKRPRVQDAHDVHSPQDAYYGRSYYLGGAAAPELLKRMLALMPSGQSDLLFAFSGTSESDHVTTPGDYIFPTLFSATTTCQDLLEMLRNLGRPEAGKLLDAYFEIVDPLHHYSPTPWINSLYEKCWSGEVSADELALIYVVLALGDLVSSNTQAWFFVSISTQLLRISNFLANPTLNCIFTFSYVGVYQQHEGRLGQYWPVLGLVMRLCQSMALHRDPDLVLSVSKEESELRRRAFWTVAAQETAVSSMFGRPDGIGFTDCKLPSNISDDELFGGLGRQGRDHGNEIAYNLLTWELSMLTKDVLKAPEQGKLGDAVELANMEQRIKRWLFSVPLAPDSEVGSPSAFMLSSPNGRQTYVQKICLNLIAHHDILLLYRKAVLGGSTPEARKPCFEAAFAMSHCWRELQDRFPKMARVTWMHWFRAFHAALMCLIAIRERTQAPEIYAQAMACWMSFLRIFNRIKDQNPSVASCSRALNRLDAVLKSETGATENGTRSSMHKEIQDISTQLLIPMNSDAHPVADDCTAHTPSQRTTIEGAAAAGDFTALSAVEPTTTAFEAQLQPTNHFPATMSSNLEVGATLDAFTAGDALNLFDLDIQNWPDWLTNDESPNF